MSNYKRETLIRVNLISVSLSLLLYVTGWLIAARAGFFARMFKRKIIVASIGFVFLFVKNMLDNPPHFLSSLVKFGFFAAMLALIAQFFFKRTPEQKNNASDVPAAGHTERLNLADYHLTKTEEYYIYAIVEKIPYKAIARNAAKSESTVKREMLLLFKRFGFQTHTNFYNHLKNIIIDYSQFTPPQPS